MREILSEIVRQTVGLFEAVKVTGAEGETKIQAIDADKSLFLNAKFNLVVPEFEGQFGISNLGLLSGLLKFASYRTDDSKLEVVRKNRKGVDTVDYFHFEDANGEGAATHRAMSAELVDEQVMFREVPWDVTITPQKAKVAEFEQLARLYNEVDKSFSVFTQKGNLMFSIGDGNSTSHHSVITFERGVDGVVTNKPAPVFNTAQFLGVMNVAGSNPVTLSVYGKGLLLISVTTPLANYNYYLRAKK